jgi:hypothetical protein
MDDNTINNIAAGLADAMETMQPMFETANGIKARMVKDGWSQASAESIALTWLNGAITTLWDGARQMRSTQ